MPTENRSSNTEMVSVPEGFMLVERSIWTEQQVEAATACITRLKGVPGMRDCDLAMAAIDAAQCKAPDIALSDLLPAPQPHPEPIAWMVGTAFWRTKEEAERDAAATRLPIVGLGPMADNGEAARLRVELGHMREERDDLSAKLDRFYSRTHGIKNLSAIEQLNDKLAERDALRAALQFYADREHFSEDMRSDWDSVSGEPANVLWHEDEAWFVEDGSIARHALSASAEPSAPKCETCSDHGAVGNILNAEPCPDCSCGQPVERDERAEFEADWAYRMKVAGHRERANAFYRIQPNDRYRWNDVQDAWEAWQARAALERKP